MLDCLKLLVPLAGRAILQVDQTTFENQNVFWHLRECGEDTDMDSNFGVCSYGNSEETVEFGLYYYSEILIRLFF